MRLKRWGRYFISKKGSFFFSCIVIKEFELKNRFGFFGGVRTFFSSIRFLLKRLDFIGLDKKAGLFVSLDLLESSDLSMC